MKKIHNVNDFNFFWVTVTRDLTFKKSTVRRKEYERR